MEVRQNVQVMVKTEYVEEQSEPEKERYVFAYHITIENNDDEVFQLLNRYWLITDGNGKKSEVAGSGVIGQQPYIETGKQFSYSSGCVLDTPIGTMEGHYEMQASDGTLVKVAIPVFRLSVPNLLH